MAVTLHTDLGDLKLELFCDKCPRTCEVCSTGNCKDTGAPGEVHHPGLDVKLAPTVCRLCGQYTKPNRNSNANKSN